MVDLLPGLKAGLLTRARKKVNVQFVLTATIIYLAMALDLPPWAHKAIDKIRQSKFWRGHKEAKGAHCLVAWDTMCRPTDRGASASPISIIGWALRARWLLFKKTEPHHPWTSLEVQVSDQVRVLFTITVNSDV
jgi:hypothetical protein